MSQSVYQVKEQKERKNVIFPDYVQQHRVKVREESWPLLKLVPSRESTAAFAHRLRPPPWKARVVAAETVKIIY